MCKKRRLFNGNHGKLYTHLDNKILVRAITGSKKQPASMVQPRFFHNQKIHPGNKDKIVLKSTSSSTRIKLILATYSVFKVSYLHNALLCQKRRRVNTIPEKKCVASVVFLFLLYIRPKEKKSKYEHF